MIHPRHLTREELDRGLDHIRLSPADEGLLELIVRRPMQDAREVLNEAVLCTTNGLLGDNWRWRGSSRTADGSAHPDMQLNIMNARVINLLAQAKELWQLAGDQLFVDMDLSARNVPPGTQLALGAAVIEVTNQPHTGCQKFAARFGLDALKFVSSPLGRELNLRGINARVLHTGRIRVGDVLKKL
jgi:hypothetical protein